FGTYTVRAKEEEEAEQLLNDTIMLEQLGCFGVVLEKIPASLAKKATASVKIPIIGIGAGPLVDGQVLVLHDMLGMNKEFSPRFLRRYSDLDKIIHNAVEQYTQDVKSKDFPNETEQY
ncbi:MAG: 3-methyl-2-oxobutanoate hydroxymethyltransferase, partial [Flavobacteriaceae bacterium]